MNYQPHGCPIRFSLSLFGDKWSLLIIRDLMFKKRCYYSEFLNAGEEISTNILADRLARLERHDVIVKSRDPTHGKKFVYRLSPKGLDLMPVMLAMMDWAETYDEHTEVPEDFIDKLRNRPGTLRKEILAGIERP